MCEEQTACSVSGRDHCQMRDCARWLPVHLTHPRISHTAARPPYIRRPTNNSLTHASLFCPRPARSQFHLRSSYNTTICVPSSKTSILSVCFVVVRVTKLDSKCPFQTSARQKQRESDRSTLTGSRYVQSIHYNGIECEN